MTARVTVPPMVFFVRTRFRRALIRRIRAFFALKTAGSLASTQDRGIRDHGNFAIFIGTRVRHFGVFQVIFGRCQYFGIFFHRVALVLEERVGTPMGQIFGLPTTIFRGNRYINMVRLHRVNLGRTFRA